MGCGGQVANLDVCLLLIDRLEVIGERIDELLGWVDEPLLADLVAQLRPALLVELLRLLPVRCGYNRYLRHVLTQVRR